MNVVELRKAHHKTLVTLLGDMHNAVATKDQEEAIFLTAMGIVEIEEWSKEEKFRTPVSVPDTVVNFQEMTDSSWKTFYVSFSKNTPEKYEMGLVNQKSAAVFLDRVSLLMLISRNAIGVPESVIDYIRNNRFESLTHSWKIKEAIKSLKETA